MQPAIVHCAAALLAALALQDPARQPSTGPAPSLVPALQAPPPIRMPSDGWTPADQGPDAVARGQAALRRTAAAYRDAPAMRDRLVIRATLPDGVRTEEADLALGMDGSFRVDAGGYRVICAGGKVGFIPDQPDDRCLVRPVEGSGHATMVAMLGSAPLPLPHLGFRQPLAGAAEVDAFAECGIGKGGRVAGCREADDRTQVLLRSDGAEAVVSVDRSSGFVRSVDSVFSPPGAPEGLRIAFGIAATPTVGALAAPIVLDTGSRKVSASIEEMFGAPDAPPPAGSSVANGAPAPVEALEDLDGKAFDLASLRGKAVVIDFWATWCGPCRRGLPVLQRFADEMKDDPRVAVLAVDVWEQCEPAEVVAKVRDACGKLGLRVPVLLDRDGSLIRAYGFPAIPATVVIAPDGTLAASHMGLPQDLAAVLRADVAKALGTAK